jgi:hypothetical protein
MYKPLFLFLTLALAGNSKGQHIGNFEFWISSLDKAAYGRVTYHITADSIIIKDGPYDFIYFAKNYKDDKVVFEQKLDSLEEIGLYKIADAITNDTLKSQYTNLCIIDGTILHFHFEWADKNKATTLSNYYLDKMKPFVDFVNKNVPTKYKIYYDKVGLEKLMKDCPSDRILD